MRSGVNIRMLEKDRFIKSLPTKPWGTARKLVERGSIFHHPLRWRGGERFRGWISGKGLRKSFRSQTRLRSEAFFQSSPAVQACCWKQRRLFPEVAIPFVIAGLPAAGQPLSAFGLRSLLTLCSPVNAVNEWLKSCSVCSVYSVVKKIPSCIPSFKSVR